MCHPSFNRHPPPLILPFCGSRAARKPKILFFASKLNRRAVSSGPIVRNHPRLSISLLTIRSKNHVLVSVLACKFYYYLCFTKATFYLIKLREASDEMRSRALRLPTEISAAAAAHLPGLCPAPSPTQERQSSSLCFIIYCSGWGIVIAIVIGASNLPFDLIMLFKLNCYVLYCIKGPFLYSCYIIHYYQAP